jgi:rubrerythrin
MDRDPSRATAAELLANFLASSFFAEDEATPVVDKLLRHPTDDEERALLLSYAREEDGHARILDGELARRGLPKGEPFWIQRIFRRMSARTSLLVEFYHVEILAGCFYAAVAARVDDAAARDLLRRLLRDESRHIRLHRELLARQIARLGVLGRLKARVLCFLFRWAFFVTAWYQARQLAPILGAAGPPLRRKILNKLRADRAFLFAPRRRPPRPLDWWWTPPHAHRPTLARPAAPASVPA